MRTMHTGLVSGARLAHVLRYRSAGEKREGEDSGVEESHNDEAMQEMIG